MALPAALTLPSGLRVRLTAAGGARPGPRAKRDPLFADALRLFDDGVVSLTKGKERVDVGALPLGDFHVLRAVLTKHGLIEEESLSFTCRNCGAEMETRPCAALEIGPWVSGELGDEELDATLPFGAPIDVPPVPLGRVRSARTVTFAPRTVDEARPLFAALARDPFDVTPAVVRAMGVAALGKETDPGAIARALADCDDDAFGAVAAAFLDSHYPPRLGAFVFCDACGARNDVDAPADRELGGLERPPREAHAQADAFPSLDAFAARADAIAEPRLAALPGDPVKLVVEGGTPAVDDGGEPLLGSYVPPAPGDLATVTVYFRTFEAMWNDDGPYDWDAELEETIEHELEHHVYFLRGDDPMDDEERAAIGDEAVRIVGAREARRRAIQGLGASFGDFLRRTWPLWVIAAVALAVMLATQR